MATDFDKTFLARAPKFIAAGHTMDEAIKLAFEEEEAFCIEMAFQKTQRAQMAQEVICHTVYQAFTAQDARNKLYRRLEQIEGMEAAQ